MISQSLFHFLQDLVVRRNSYVDHAFLPLSAREVSRFIRPYALIIHRPSHRGYYVDKGYFHIIDVCHCKAPAGVCHKGKVSPMGSPPWTNIASDDTFDTYYLEQK